MKCSCKESLKPVKARRWLIRQLWCSHSAFSGYQQRSSATSLVHCVSCGMSWRTSSRYVDDLQHDPGYHITKPRQFDKKHGWRVDLYAPKKEKR